MNLNNLSSNQFENKLSKKKKKKEKKKELVGEVFVNCEGGLPIGAAALMWVCDLVAFGVVIIGMKQVKSCSSSNIDLNI